MTARASRPCGGVGQPYFSRVLPPPLSPSPLAQGPWTPEAHLAFVESAPLGKGTRDFVLAVCLLLLP